MRDSTVNSLQNSARIDQHDSATTQTVQKHTLLLIHDQRSNVLNTCFSSQLFRLILQGNLAPKLTSMTTHYPGGGGGYVGKFFPGFRPLPSQNPHPIVVYSVVINPILVTFEL